MKPACTLLARRDDIVSRMPRTSYPDEMEFGIQRVGINIGGLPQGEHLPREYPLAWTS